MTGQVTGLVPFVHVADVERSAAFYRLLGLEVNDRFEPRGRLAWVWMEHGDARIMLTLADAPVAADAQAVLFYLYSPDLAGLREHLVASGVPAGEIVDGTPGPREEMRVVDPDGYVLMIAQIAEDTG